LISAPELSKHLTTSQCPDFDATNNGDCPFMSHKLISDRNGKSPLSITSITEPYVERLLFLSGADINFFHNAGKSPFFLAI
jgi:hypothetical protein